jgi:hypothetical protein
MEIDDSLPMPRAIGKIRKEYRIPVLSILNLNDIIGGLIRPGSDEEVRRVQSEVQSSWLRGSTRFTRSIDVNLSLKTFCWRSYKILRVGSLRKEGQ